MRTRLASNKEKLRASTQECVRLRKDNVYKKLLRLRRKARETGEKLGNVQAQVVDVQSQMLEERNKKRKYQQVASKSEAKRRKLENDLEEVTAALETEQNENIATPELRNNKGHFKEEVVMCVMELNGECEVPARRCSFVIQTVAHHLFKTDLPGSALPSKTSLRFVHQTHAVAKLQIADALTSNKYDLHADGTSRSTKKYIGFQVTLEDKSTLGLGFDPVAHDTAQTILDLALHKLSELSLFTLLTNPRRNSK